VDTLALLTVTDSEEANKKFQCNLRQDRPDGGAVKAASDPWRVTVDPNFLPDLIEGLFVSGGIPIKVQHHYQKSSRLISDL